MSTRSIFVFAAVALAGCTRGADLPAALVADDSDAVFDTVADAPASERRFGFTNVGSEATTPLAVAVNGDRDLFVIDGDDCSNTALKPHAHCDVIVRLDGLAAGDFDGELRVFGAEPVSASVVLHGKVAPTDLDLEPVGSSIIDAKQGQTAIMSFTVHNRGGARSGPLHVSGTSLPLDIDDDRCEGVTLDGGASCTIALGRNLAYGAPVGTASGTLRVEATPGGVVTDTPTVVVHANGAIFVTASVDFGTVPTITATRQTITLSNPGSLDSGALSLAVVEQYSPFRIVSDGCTGQSIGSGRSCDITIEAYLLNAGVNRSTLRIGTLDLGPTDVKLEANAKRIHWLLTMLFAGTGSGTVTTSGSPGLSTAFSIALPNGQPSPPLTAVADSGSTFAGWSGAMQCSGTGSCAPFVGADNSDVTVTATFTR